MIRFLKLSILATVFISTKKPERRECMGVAVYIQRVHSHLAGWSATRACLGGASAYSWSCVTTRWVEARATGLAR